MRNLTTMERMIKVLLLAIIVIGLLVGSSLLTTGAYFTDTEESTDNALRISGAPPPAAPTVNAGHTTSITPSSELTHVIDTPTHSAGDAIYLFAVIDSAVTMTPPSGFTAVSNLDNELIQTDRGTASLWRKIATTSEPSTYTWTSDATDRSVQIAWSQSGDGGVDVSGTPNGGSGTTTTCPAVTTTVADTLVLRLVAADYGQAVQGEDWLIPLSTGSGYTKLAELEYKSAGMAHVQYITQASAGSTGTLDVTMSESEQWAAFTVAIAPISQ